MRSMSMQQSFSNSVMNMTEQDINERYSRMQEAQSIASQNLPDEALKPTKQDASLWMLKCKATPSFSTHFQLNY